MNFKEYRSIDASDVYYHRICVGSIIKYFGFWLLTCNYKKTSHIPEVSSHNHDFKFKTREAGLEKLYELLDVNKEEIEIIEIQK